MAHTRTHKTTQAAIPQKILLWGCSGQAFVVREIIDYYKARVVAVFDDDPDLISPFADIPLLHGDSDFDRWIACQDMDDLGFCVTIGNKGGLIRLRIHGKLASHGIQPTRMIHPTAWVAKSAAVEAGVQILSGAIVSPACTIGRESIINTNASVDHHTRIGEGVEIAPGATLCGYVQVGKGSLVGAGATVLSRVVIGENTTVGAGSLVNRSVPDNVTVMGIPAKIVQGETSV